MIKYILAGGADTQSKGYGTKLAEVLQPNNEPLKILSCMFSQPRGEWEFRFKVFKKFFQDNLGKDTICVLASPEDFVNQIVDVDVIYLHGGEVEKLKQLIADCCPNFKDLIEGKVVVGSSAGAQFISSVFFRGATRKTYKGKGLVPVAVIVHFGSNYRSSDGAGPIDWDKALLETKKAAGSLPIVCLKEGELAVFER